MGRAFKASGAAPPAGVLLTLGIGLVAAAGIAFVMKLISQWMFLILIFPALMGAGVGVVLMLGVKAGKVRNPTVAGILALICGAVCYVGLHYVDYLEVSNIDNLQQMVRDELPSASEEEVEYTAAVIYAQVGADFFTYLDFMANEVGVSFTGASSSSSGSGLTLTGVGAYSVWGVEALIVILVALFIPMGAAKRPFCERSGQWYQPGAVFKARSEDGSAILSTLLSPDGQGAAPYLSRDYPAPNTVLTFSESPSDPDADVYFEVMQSSIQNKKTTSRRLGKGMLTRAEYDAIRDYVANPPAPADDIVAQIDPSLTGL